MKKILLYNTRIWHPAIWHNMRSLEKAFRRQGVKVLLIDMDDKLALNKGFFLLMNDKELSFSIGPNNLGISYMQNNNEIFPYAELSLPHISYTLDVPYNKYGAGFADPVKESIVTMLDRDLNDLLPIMYPEKKMHTLFLPLAGTSALDRDKVFEQDRIYDVVYSASVWNNGDLYPHWREEILNKFILKILDDVVDLLKESPISTYCAFKKVLFERGMLSSEYIKQFLPYFAILQEYIKTYRRVHALRMLTELNVNIEVIGDGWENVPFARKLHLHGAVPYEKTLEMFSKAKVVYQDNADFGNGGHDRVFTAMLNGAVVVSEYSKYLAEEFVEGKEIFLFDWKNTSQQIKVVENLIHDEYMRLSVALLAFEKADKYHRWDNRAQSLIEVVAVLYGDRLS